MIEKNKNKVGKYKEIIIFVIGCLLQIIIFVIGNYAGAVFSAAPLEVFIISVIVIAIGFICWVIVRLIICNFLLAGDSAKYHACRGMTQGDNTIEQCHIMNNICCLKLMLKREDINISIDEHIKKKFKLYDAASVGKIEKDGIGTLKWKNIWVFSDDLSTELDSYNSAKSVVVANITNKSIQYCFFYIDSQKMRREILQRKELMVNSLNDNSHKNKMDFCPLNVKINGYIGQNTLPLLCGSILFSSKSDQNGVPIFEQGYLSIRNRPEEQPLYYKLPRCMLAQYAQYFINKYKSKHGGVK